MSQAPVVAQLRSHIDELSDTIAAQIRLLRDLEAQRSTARSKLNSFLDPMARLPLEIQSRIFLDVTKPNEPIPDPQDVPLVFLSICQLWRVIALATPRLWTGVELNCLPRRPAYAEVGKNWMERAGPFPLSLVLHGSLRLERSVQDLVTSYRHRFESLSLKLGMDRNPDEDGLTRRIYIKGPFPALQKLTLGADEEMFFSTVHDWITILRQAPALVQCRMENMMFDWEDEGLPDTPQAHPLTHTSLRDLSLGDAQGYGLWGLLGNSAFVLNFLTLPALRTLRLSELDITNEEVNAFFTRSSAPLESLSMVVPTDPEWAPQEAVEFFQPIQARLRQLELVAPYRGDPNCAVAFVETLDGWLPALQRLTIHMACGSQPDYQRLLNILHARRTSMTAFNLLFSTEFGHNYDADVPSTEVLTALGNLVRNGMQIHVGPQAQNFLG
ncbi:hypothetical protein R3P38DRAFT_3058358 [Favolaschia claudopus]|uniref:F-box domain-containing protein n=1 Tax=Favolaschia claudopus TaxID=2862362 RepID=A0AAW0A3P0_9AGAR